MNCAWHGLLLSIGLAVSPGASAQGDPPPGIAPIVGDLQFDGCVAHTPEEIAAALSKNLEYRIVVATAPPVQRAKVVERLLTAGLLRGGHPDAKVSANVDENGALMVSVHEGPQLVCGELVITGALERVSAEALRALLTPSEDAVKRVVMARAQEVNQSMLPPGMEFLARDGPGKPSSDSKTNAVVPAAVLGWWNPGKPAPLDPWAPRYWPAAVSNAFAELLHFFPVFELRMVRDRDAGRADLVLSVVSEGPACTVGEVVVEGAIRNRPEDVIAAAGLRPGMPLTQTLVRNAEGRLRETVRMRGVRIVPSRPGADGRSPVTICVTEIPEMPLLTEELSPLARDALRLGRWLEAFPASSDELSIEAHGTYGWADVPLTFTLTVAPTQGVHAVVRGLRSQAASNSLIAMALADGTRAVYSPDRRCKYEVDRVSGGVAFYLHMKERTGRPLETRGWADLEMGVGIASGTTTLAEVSVQCDPVVMAYKGYSTNSQARMEGGDWVLDGRADSIRFDAATGRLQGARGVNKNNGYELHVATGVLARAVRDTRAQSVGWTNRYDPAKPIASLVAFIGPDILPFLPLSPQVTANLTPQQWQAAQRGVERVLNALRDADADDELRVKTTAKTGRSRLAIPREASILPPGRGGVLAQGILWMTGELSRMAPQPGYWMTEVLRAYALGLCGQRLAMAQAMDALIRSPQSGPLALEVAALLAGDLSADAARGTLTLAMTRLSAAKFVRDVEPLLDRNTPGGRMLMPMVTAAGTLTDEEADALTAFVPAPYAEPFRRLLRDLGTGGPGDANARFLAALGRYWEEGGLRELQARGLRMFRDRINTGCLGIPAPCDAARAAPGVIDLGGVYNASLTNVFGSSEQASNCIQVLSATLQRVGDCDFDVRGLVLTAPPSQQRRMPMEVRGIALGRACRRLHFLHAVLGPGALENERQVVQYRIAYADRRSDAVDVLVGRDIANARVADDDTAKRPAVAWEVADPQGGTAGGRVRFYVQTWDNPRPDVPIASIDMANWHTRAMPFLVALSASP